MDDLTFKPVHTFPIRGIAFRMFIISLAHPKEIASKMDGIPEIPAPTTNTSI
jgi:hypothetical protein